MQKVNSKSCCFAYRIIQEHSVCVYSVSLIWTLFVHAWFALSKDKNADQCRKRKRKRRKSGDDTALHKNIFFLLKK